MIDTKLARLQGSRSHTSHAAEGLAFLEDLDWSESWII